jgi:hypothetical protein
MLGRLNSETLKYITESVSFAEGISISEKVKRLGLIIK